MIAAARATSPAARGAAAQARTIGALIMRELHTRFGRNNVGYLWLFIEPGLLGAGVATVHVLSGLPQPFGMEIFPYYVVAYTAYCLFRTSVNRSCSTVEANRGLLYHRPVTIVDLLAARALLEGAATFGAGLLLLVGATVLGLGHLPERPLLFLTAWGLNLWFCFGLSLLCCAGCVVMPTLERFIHPATYLMLPLSGVFTIFEMVPPYARQYMLWIPTAHITEMVREGTFATFDSAYTDGGYVLAWCAGLTFLGLLALRAVRPRILL